MEKRTKRAATVYLYHDNIEFLKEVKKENGSYSWLLNALIDKYREEETKQS